MSDPVEPESSDDRRSERGGVGLTLMGWGLGLVICALVAALAAWGFAKLGAIQSFRYVRDGDRPDTVLSWERPAPACDMPVADQKTIDLIRARQALVDPASETPPEWIVRPIPMYPELALDQDVHAGVVAVTCIISQQGPPDACRVESETPPGVGFAEEAMASLCAVEIKPATVNGEPHRTVATWTIRFATRE